MKKALVRWQSLTGLGGQGQNTKNQKKDFDSLNYYH